MEWLNGLSDAERFTALVAFFAALLGGGISLVTTLISGWFSNRYDRKLQAQEHKKIGALKVYAALQSLIHTANISLNLSLHLGEAFDEAERNGRVDAEPWEKVKPIIGQSRQVQLLDISETLFLIDAKKTNLISEISLLQHRVQNNEAVIEAYNKHRMEFTDFLETRVSSTANQDNAIGVVELEGSEARMGDIRGGTLNKLLGDLLQNLELDSPEAKRVTEEFCKAATSYFGDSFPKISVKWS